MRAEGKPWEQAGPDGTLNYNSYAAMAAFGLVELAVSSLSRAGAVLSVASIRALSETFALVVSGAQHDLGWPASMQDGSHSRLRGALRTSLEISPPPIGGDEAAFAAWVEATRRRLVRIAQVAEAVWEGSEADPAPWRRLVGAGEDAPARAAVPA
jgi:hypothetical protein